MQYALVDKLLRKSIVTSNGCFEWRGYCVGKGYGRLNYAGKAWLVHRLVWTLTNGEIPTGIQVDHRCENKKCWNVLHLQLATNKVNQELRSKRRTHCVNNHVLTDGTIYQYGNRRVCKQCQAVRAAKWYRRIHAGI